jgi:hypothetical protein
VALAGPALIANSSALALNDGRRLAVMPVGLVAVVGVSIARLFAIGSPFRGAFVASHYPIDQVVADLQTGGFHA